MQRDNDDRHDRDDRIRDSRERPRDDGAAELYGRGATQEPPVRTRSGGAEPPPRFDDDIEPHARQIEPKRVDVERRDDADRRVADHPVEHDRRVADRRAAEERAALEARERRAYIVARVTQGVDYLFYLLYGLLGIRFVLTLLGASEQAGFVQYVTGMTQPFYAPFAGIVARPAVNGGMLDFPLLIAVLAYALLHMAVRGLLRLMVGRAV